MRSNSRLSTAQSNRRYLNAEDSVEVNLCLTKIAFRCFFTLKIYSAPILNDQTALNEKF